MFWGGKDQQPVDLAFVFVGRELSSLYVSGSKHADPAFVDLLKVPFARSNISVTFSYVAVPEEKEAMENSLILVFFYKNSGTYSWCQQCCFPGVMLCRG